MSFVFEVPNIDAGKVIDLNCRSKVDFVLNHPTLLEMLVEAQVAIGEGA